MAQMYCKLKSTVLLLASLHLTSCNEKVLFFFFLGIPEKRVPMLREKSQHWMNKNTLFKEVLSTVPTLVNHKTSTRVNGMVLHAHFIHDR